MRGEHRRERLAARPQRNRNPRGLRDPHRLARGAGPEAQHLLVGDRAGGAGPAPGGHRARRRLHRRRRLHGNVDRVLPQARRPLDRRRDRRAKLGGVRGVRAQRRLRDDRARHEPSPPRRAPRSRARRRRARGGRAVGRRDRRVLRRARRGLRLRDVGLRLARGERRTGVAARARPRGGAANGSGRRVRVFRRRRRARGDRLPDRPGAAEGAPRGADQPAEARARARRSPARHGGAHPRALSGGRDRARQGDHAGRRGDHREERRRDERLPALDPRVREQGRADLELRDGHRAAHRRADGPRRVARPRGLRGQAQLHHDRPLHRRQPGHLGRAPGAVLPRQRHGRAPHAKRVRLRRAARRVGRVLPDVVGRGLHPRLRRLRRRSPGPSCPTSARSAAASTTDTATTATASPRATRSAARSPTSSPDASRSTPTSSSSARRRRASPASRFATSARASRPRCSSARTAAWTRAEGSARWTR